MRIATWIVLVMLLLLEAILFMAFTASGNDILLPFVNRYIQHKVPQAKIDIEKFRLKPDHIGVIAKINDTIDLKAAGALNALSRRFDINYILDTNQIKTPSLTINEHIHIHGNAKGTPNDMKIHGNGLAFGSKLRYQLALLKNMPQNIKIDINGANLKSLLAVAGQKPYSTGRLTLHANMPYFSPLNPQVRGTLNIKDGKLNSTLISKDFKINLPQQTTYSSNFVIKTQNKKVIFDGTLNSSLANLNLENGKFDILNNALSSNYKLNIAKLESLSSITKSQLRGDLTLNGTLHINKKSLAVDGESGSFGGKTKFAYQGDRLHAELLDIQNATLLYKLGQPKYLTGNTSATIDLNSIKNLTGKFNIATSGSADNKLLKEKFDLDLGDKFNLNANIRGKLKNKKMLASITTKTTMANLKLSPLNYDIKNKILSGDYTLNIPDLGKLKPLTKKSYKGSMSFIGNIKKDKALLITGEGKEFGGSIDFRLLDDNLIANATGITVSKLLYMLDYPQMLDAISKAQVKYNLKSKSGTMHAKLDNARILPTQLTKLLKQFQVIDLAKERFNDTTFDAKIDPQKIDFTLKAKNKNNYLIANPGRLIKKTDVINIKLNMKLKGVDLQATISGTTKRPKVSLDGSNYLKNRLKQKIKQRYGKQINNAKKKIKNRVKEKVGNSVGDKLIQGIRGLF